MKKLLTLLTITAFLAIPTESNAQGLLKNLKDKVVQEVGNTGIGSVLGGTSTESSQAKKTTSSYSAVKPSTAKDARTLLGELPAIPSAAQIAMNEDGFRNHFFDQVYAVQNRIDQLKGENQVNEDEDDERAQANMLMKLMGGGQTMQMSSLQNIDVAKVQANSVNNQNRLNEIQVELNELEAKYEKNGTLTAAEQARGEALSKEVEQIMESQVNALSAGGMDLNSLMNMAQAASNASQAQMAQIYGGMNGGKPSMGAIYELEYDKNFAAFKDKVELLNEKTERGYKDSGSAKDQETLNQIKNLFNQIWKEQNPETVKQLYSQVVKLTDEFEAIRAQARINEYQGMYNECLALIGEAEKFIPTFPENSYIPKYAVLNGPLAVVEVWASLMLNLWGAEGDTYIDSAYEPFQKIKINLPLQPGDALYRGESNIYQMLDSKYTSAVFTVKGSETIEQDFVNNATLLVYNNNDKNFYKIEKGQRSRLGSQYNNNYNFLKRYETSGRKNASLKMKSLDKTIEYNTDNYLHLPIPGEGRWYSPIAIQATNDWLIFITVEEDGNFYKCMYRL